MTEDGEFSALDGLRRLDDEWVQQRHPGTPRRARVEAAARPDATIDDRITDAPASAWEERDPSPHTSGSASSPVGQFALSVVAPGSAALRRHPFVGVALLAVGVVLPVVLLAIAVLNRDRLVGLALDGTVLLFVAGVLLLSVVTRLVAVGEVAGAHRFRRGVALQAGVAVAVVLGLSIPVLGVAYRAVDARSTLSGVFADGSDEPLFVPAAPPAVDPSAVKNILILGGDAGPGRWGMRTDTMMLVSVHEASGRTALTSIPRNLTGLQFPPGTPLADQFPNGFDDLANAVFTHVNTDPALTAHYGADGLQPEAIALVQGLGYSLGVEIDDYALVNMQGFTDVIDAVGGVTVELAQSVPLPPTLPGERPLPEAVGPGLVEMDGALAVAYARSRSADSDYQRMGRQRQLLAALGSQVSPTEALGAFGTVAGVLDDSMRTSLSAGEFDDLLSRLGDNAAIMESVGLAPPLITPGSPDYAEIKSIVAGIEQAVVSGTPSGYGS